MIISEFHGLKDKKILIVAQNAKKAGNTRTERHRSIVVSRADDRGQDILFLKDFKNFLCLIG